MKVVFRIVSIVLIVIGACGARAAGTSDLQIKAAYLYNFAKFIDWPVECGAERDAPFVIGIRASDKFRSVVEATVRNQNLGGRPILIRSLSAGDSVAGCQIVFVSGVSGQELKDLLSEAKAACALTVSDENNFATRGGMVEFVDRRSRVRFKINRNLLVKAGLAVSSKLLSIAVEVY